MLDNPDADQLFGNLGAGDNPIRLHRFASGAGPMRSYVAPMDLARVILELSALPPQALPPVLNLTGPAPVAMADLVRAAGRGLDWVAAPDGALPMMHLSDALLKSLAQPLAQSSDPVEMVRQWRQFGAHE